VYYETTLSKTPSCRSLIFDDDDDDDDDGNDDDDNDDDDDDVRANKECKRRVKSRLRYV